VIWNICGLLCSAGTFRASSPFRVVDFQDYRSYNMLLTSGNNFLEYFRLTVYKMKTNFMLARQSDSDTCNLPIPHSVRERGPPRHDHRPGCREHSSCFTLRRVDQYRCVSASVRRRGHLSMQSRRPKFFCDAALSQSVRMMHSVCFESMIPRKLH
jgi:hypothetical protein